VVTDGASSSAEFLLDESQPTTFVQIRLADGKRLKAKFNLGHTIADVHAYLKK
jgi:UBX domain-containing protein 1